MVPIDYKNNQYLADLRKFILIQLKKRSNNTQKTSKPINKQSLRKNKIKRERKKDRM